MDICKEADKAKGKHLQIIPFWQFKISEYILLIDMLLIQHFLN